MVRSGAFYTQRTTTRSQIINYYLLELAFVHVVHFRVGNASETRPDGAVVEVEGRQRNPHASVVAPLAGGEPAANGAARPCGTHELVDSAYATRPVHRGGCGPPFSPLSRLSASEERRWSAGGRL